MLGRMKEGSEQMRQGEERPGWVGKKGKRRARGGSQFPTVTLLSAGAENFASIGAAGERHGQTVIRVSVGQGVVGRQHRGGARISSAQRCPLGMGQGKETPGMGKAPLILSCLQAPTGPRLGSPCAVAVYSNYPSYSVLLALLLVHSLATHTRTHKHTCLLCVFCTGL